VRQSQFLVETLGQFSVAINSPLVSNRRGLPHNTVRIDLTRVAVIVLSGCSPMQTSAPRNLAYWSAEIPTPPLPSSSTGSLQKRLSSEAKPTDRVVLPHIIARRQPELQIVLAREVQLTRHYFLARHRGMSRMPRVRAVADYVAAVVQEHRDGFLAS